MTTLSPSFGSVLLKKHKEYDKKIAAKYIVMKDELKIR